MTPHSSQSVLNVIETPLSRERPKVIINNKIKKKWFHETPSTDLYKLNEPILF